jgi:prophage regulatory protein
MVLNRLRHQRRRLSMRQNEPLEIRKTIRRHQLREMVPLADSTIYEMEQRGEFPRRFALSPRCIVWDLAEVQAWLLARRTKPIHRAQHPDVTQRKSRPVKGLDRAQQEA